ncbi:TetR family transcriptional regulator [Nocardia cyriacigeorgica]|uniref:TetR/AcrR family transcriptional regulator n=1 Tax=Nocardia cyriacigeorgica TaxID=135487 RepID=UPI0018962E44|nr:TetR family transcriptional regulator [Nocardia cyriacigeorgica]MBF6089081.1 TetR family transcriptional regulator [Nocardia cyriacigeorgica]MBF6095863.1 TetR family transcriptional regulator [Nocardia cyriacigeorgica]MBF6397941.1 TetR family transcriptional regulator [Nocardia cyriacigeorgica]MBF6404545.1 TetR family transcriptional regulator [Nocardia cyriacigeorgica]
MTTETAEPQGLRAKKKQQTRENISHQATLLFLERGFDKVTIADVAAAAQVAKMTVTNYFPRKEDLALDLGEVFVDQLARTVREREPGESALAALRRAYLTAAAEQDPVVGFSGPDFAGMIAASSALVARLREFHDDREAALARTLAEETGAAPDAITPRVAAAQLAGVHRVLFDETMRRTLAGQSNDEIAAALTGHITTAFDALEPSLGTYAVR